MSQVKPKRGFVTPFSQSLSSTASQFQTERKQCLPHEKTEVKALSPMYLGRNVQTITPLTRQKIKQRFACAGLSHVSTKDSSPGIYVPFELSQASCISREGIDNDEEIVQENDEIVTGIERSEVDRPDSKEEDGFDMELPQDVSESVHEENINNTRDETDDTEAEKPVIDKEHSCEDLQFDTGDNASIPEVYLAVENNGEDMPGNNKRSVGNESSKKSDKVVAKGDRGKNNDEKVKVGRKKFLQVKMPSRGKGTEQPKTGTGIPGPFKKTKKEKATGKLSAQIPRRNRGKGEVNTCSKTRRRKTKRSFQEVKRGVLETLYKMHREIQELLERRKILVRGDVGDKGNELELQGFAKSQGLIQEE